MRYNIFDSVAPAMPKPAKGTKCIKTPPLKGPKVMREMLFPMFFTYSAHM